MYICYIAVFHSQGRKISNITLTSAFALFQGTSSNSCTENADPTASTSRINHEPGYPLMNLESISNPEHKEFLLRLDLTLEEDRRKTFSKWPSYPAPYLVSSLAKEGFFYLGNLDRVQCYSCSGILRNWEPQDDVNDEHKKNFPHCRISHGQSEDNVPLADSTRSRLDEEHMNHVRELDSIGVNEPYPALDEQRLLSLQYPCENPTNETLTALQSRVQTFNHNWPHPTLQVSRMAKAGFFYLGESDRTKCFYCNGGLQNWEEHDDPWIEHAKWFPTCEFIIRRRGSKFVRRITDAHPNLDRLGSRDENSTTPSPQTAQELDPAASTENESLPSEDSNNHSNILPGAGTRGGRKRPGSQPARPPAKLQKVGQEAAEESIQDQETSAQACLYQPLPSGEENVESRRRASFGSCAHRSPVMAREMARRGFFRTGLGDSAKCFSCGGVTGNWMLGFRSSHHCQGCIMTHQADEHNIPCEPTIFDEYLLAVRSTDQPPTFYRRQNALTELLVHPTPSRRYCRLDFEPANDDEAPTDDEGSDSFSSTDEEEPSSQGHASSEAQENLVELEMDEGQEVRVRPVQGFAKPNQAGPGNEVI